MLRACFVCVPPVSCVVKFSSPSLIVTVYSLFCKIYEYWLIP